MKSYLGLGVAILAGVTLGAAGISALHAQAKPSSYVVIEIEEITNAAAFSAVAQRPQTDAGARVQQAGGRYVARTDKITALDGNAPKRMIIIAFDSLEKAQAFNNIPSQKEINESRAKNTKSRSFIVQGL